MKRALVLCLALISVGVSSAAVPNKTFTFRITGIKSKPYYIMVDKIKTKCTPYEAPRQIIISCVPAPVSKAAA